MNGELSELAARITGRVGEVFDDFERMKQPRAEERVSISGHVPAPAKRELKVVCNAWRISEAALLRIALWELLKKYGFDASAILEDGDHRALNRAPGARQPLTTPDEARQRRRTTLVFAEHHGGNDPPRP